MEAIVLMSGGLDSTVCAHMLLAAGHYVSGIFIDFGQLAARKEAFALNNISKWLNVPVSTYSLSGSQQFHAGELTGRNAFLLTSSLFLSNKSTALLAIGIHSGTPYYDCSPPFLQEITKLVHNHTDGRVTVIAPLLEWTKQDIYRYALKQRIPVGHTYSCEIGNDPPCGKCQSCRDRSSLGC